MVYRFILLFILLGIGGCVSDYSCDVKSLPHDSMCYGPTLDNFFKKKNVLPGSPLFIRIFKQTRLLEVWAEKEDKTYTLIKTYKICKYSGMLGPKQKQGDKQAPEGFYSISQDSLRPKSKYYKALNIGYPNDYDIHQGYDGNHIMIHGRCHSVGCFAMTDKSIHEIYHAVEQSLKNGQTKVDVHIFPFPMNHLNFHKRSKWHGFWSQLKPMYDYFEKVKKVPIISINQKRYYLIEQKFKM